MAVFPSFGHFDMYFRHQRASGVEKSETAFFRFAPYRLRNPMRGKYQNAAGRDFIQFFDENGALFFQAVDDVSVVYDFVTDVYRFAEKRQSSLDGLDRTFDASAESSGLGQNNFHGIMVPKGRAYKYNILSSRIF
jgi:hypothetical protein